MCVCACACVRVCVCVVHVHVLITLTDAGITANIDSGIVIAVPIPQHAAPLGEEIDQAIIMALQEAKYKVVYHTDNMLFLTRRQDISGKDITPYVLQRVNEITKGKSLEASILTVLYVLLCCSKSYTLCNVCCLQYS